MGFLDNGITKEEKEQVLRRLSHIEARLSKLVEGDKDAIAEEFEGLTTFIESYITPEEKEAIDIRSQLVECLEGVRDAVDAVDMAKHKVENEVEYIKKFGAETQTISDHFTAEYAKIENLFAKANTHLTEIEKRKTDLGHITSEVEKLSALAEASKKKIINFESSVSAVEDTKNKIVLTHQNTRDLLTDVKSLHTEIFGNNDVSEENGKGQPIPGLVSKLKNSYAEIESNLVNLKSGFEVLKKNSEDEYLAVKLSWNVEFERLKTKIEGLLPGALSAGLSEAYEEKKKFEINQMDKSNFVFYISIGFLTIFSSLSACVYLWLLVRERKSLEEIAALSPIVTSILLPMYLPSLWVAYSAAKKAKLSKRLAEEYAHKSTISKTFDGISRQVSAISDNDMSRDLASKLLYNLIQVSSENPGKLISDYSKPDHPLHEVLDKSVELTESLQKLSFVPGINKIVSLIHKKNQTAIKKIDDAIPND